MVIAEWYRILLYKVSGFYVLQLHLHCANSFRFSACRIVPLGLPLYLLSKSRKD